MSQENVEVIRRAFAAAARGDMQAAAQDLDARAEIHDFDVPDAGIYHGRHGFFSWPLG